MRFERMEDMKRIRETITNPAIYPHVSDDGSPTAQEFQPIEHPAIIYLGVYEAEEYGGMFMFAPSSTACYEVHTCLLPCFWGSKAVEAARGAAKWIWLNTPCKRITTSVPVNNRLAAKLARNAGFVEWGRNEKSWLKDGVMNDQICLGLNFPVAECL